eukprot:scaffold787_cov285-Chaetoceros_neogracile.AAC.2
MIKIEKIPISNEISVSLFVVSSYFHVLAAAGCSVQEVCENRACYRGTSPSIPPKPANIPLWKVSLEPKKVSPLPECTYNTKWYPPLRVSRSQPS